MREIKFGEESPHYIHGLSHTRLDNIYKTMKARCYKETCNKYSLYGGRGIKICDEWLADKRNFFKWAHENGYKENLTIDRIDNDGDYTPDNCRWADHVEQANNRRNNTPVEYKGIVYHSFADFCRAYNLKYKVAWRYLNVLHFSLDDTVQEAGN